jgi:hypothetical protein
MFESVMLATGATMEDIKIKMAKGKKGMPTEQAKDAKEAWLNKLVINFGNDEGEEGNYTGTVIQALLLMNGQEINAIIASDKEGALARIVRARGTSYPLGVKFAINDIFMQVLGRPATALESNDLLSAKTFNFVLGKTRANTNDPAFWRAYYQDIFWALLNSNEFILNH